MLDISPNVIVVIRHVSVAVPKPELNQIIRCILLTQPGVAVAAKSMSTSLGMIHGKERRVQRTAQDIRLVERRSLAGAKEKASPVPNEIVQQSGNGRV